jgi:hypothetical protein
MKEGENAVKDPSVFFHERLASWVRETLAFKGKLKSAKLQASEGILEKLRVPSY